MRLRQLVATALVVFAVLGRPVAVDAGWSGMVVQVAAMIAQLRTVIQTAETYVNQASAEVRGLLDPGGLTSNIRSLADWRSVFSELTDMAPLWRPLSQTRGLVDDAVLNYQDLRDIDQYDFGSVGGFLEFMNETPIGWSAGKASMWQVIVDQAGLPQEVLDDIQRSDEIRKRVMDVRYARTTETRLAAARILGDHVASEFGGDGVLDETQDVIDATRRLTGGPSDPDPALSEAEAAGAVSQLAAVSASQRVAALGLRAAQHRQSAEELRLDANRAARDTQRLLARLDYIEGAYTDAILQEIADQLEGDPFDGGAGGFLRLF